MANVLNVQRNLTAQVDNHAWQTIPVEAVLKMSNVQEAKSVWRRKVNVLTVKMTLSAQMANHVWQAMSVDNAPMMITVKEAKPVWMASVLRVSVTGELIVELAAAVEMDNQRFISILSRSAALPLEELSSP